jgi:hypothetical protein
METHVQCLVAEDHEQKGKKKKVLVCEIILCFNYHFFSHN